MFTPTYLIITLVSPPILPGIIFFFENFEVNLIGLLNYIKISNNVIKPSKKITVIKDIMINI
jgi:hypothetical protein